MKHLARWMIVGGTLGLLALGGACSSDESGGGGPPPGVGGSDSGTEHDGGAGAAGEDASADASEEGSVEQDGAAGGDGAVADGEVGTDAGHDGAAGSDAGDGGAHDGAAGHEGGADADVASACATCMGGSCGTETTSCQADDNCKCWRGCYDPNANNWGSCNTECEAPGNEWFQYLQCSYQHCPSECGATFDAGLGPFDGGFSLDGGGADASADCKACLTSSCKSEQDACGADTTCACWNACYDGKNFANCQSCGMPNSEWFSTMQCRTQNCAAQCQ